MTQYKQRREFHLGRDAHYFLILYPNRSEEGIGEPVALLLGSLMPGYSYITQVSSKPL